MTFASAVAQGCAVLLTAWVAALGAATPAVAQDAFPSKPVKLIVPYPPGGASDITARLVGQKLSELWGEQVLVDNRPGANGIVAIVVAKGPNEPNERARTRLLTAHWRKLDRVSR